MLLLTTIFLLTNVGIESLTAELACTTDMLLCGDRQKCIQSAQLCDYSTDCEDASDELNFNLCKKLSVHKTRCPSTERTNFNVRCNPQYGYGSYLSNQCIDVVTACALGNKCLSAEDIPICDEITRNQLKLSWIPKELPQETKDDHYHEFYDMLEFISNAFNETIKRNFSECPPLFTPFQGKCFSFFTPAKITWPEAKLFCESITGQLIVLDDIYEYKVALDYIKAKGIKKSFWIGANLTTQTDDKSFGKWTWLSGNLVEMGAPFWSLTFQDDQEYEMCSEAVKSLLPRTTNREDKCLALLEENFHYFSDESCNLKLSPICITNINKI